VRIVNPDSPLVADEDTNVLLWSGAGNPSKILLTRHKTWRLKGTLTKALPPSIRAILAASLRILPRTTLFASEITRRGYLSEASYLAWSLRAFRGVFHGKHVTTNGARHAFLSAIDTSRLSTLELEGLAAEMGHSLGAQRAYFRLDSRRSAALRTDTGELNIPLLQHAEQRVISEKRV
jgi:hypothetical protein